MGTRLLHDRHKLVLFLDREIHDYIRAVASTETFQTKRSLSMTQCINDFLAEAIAAREKGGDIVAATERLNKELARELGVDNLDAFNETKVRRENKLRRG